MSDTELHYGSKISRSADKGATAFVLIRKAKAARPPKVETEYEEITNLDSPGGFKEWAAGLKDGGEIEIPALYTEAEYDTQIADRDLGTPIFYEVEFAGGKTFYFAGLPSPEIDDVDVGKRRTMTIKIRTTGAVRSTLADLQADFQ